ncbi:MAG TPA: cytochrome c peroxidase [Phnomibacter sp.]|nr:cytochrome c peroxidase [Phnomibacter sp.]
MPALAICTACKKSGVDADAPGTPTPVSFKIPQGWPAPVYNFAANPLTEEGIALGRKLFYDGLLSKDGNFPCGSCHQQVAAFATFDHDLSHGFGDQFTTRNAQALQNLAWMKEFHHDGGINHLDVQPIAPITAPNEMAETLENVMKKLSADAPYRKMFRAAFGVEEPNTERTMKALSQFMLTMVSANSKYDKVQRGEATFSLAESLGYQIFKEKKCNSCHAEPFFTDNSYRNTGLPLEPLLRDHGRMRITRNPADSLKFKVPSLRNVMLSFPYMHDGRIRDIFEVLEHYNSRVTDGPTTDPLVRNKIPLSNFEKGQLVAFLGTLTDQEFIADKKLAQP